MQITCCINCTPPKRHLGCHGVCPEYKEQREQLNKQNDLISQKKHEESLVPGVRTSIWQSNKR